MHVFLSQKKILRSAPWFVMFSSSWSIILLRSLQTEPRALLTFVSPKHTHTHTNQSLSAAGVNGWKRTLKVSQSTLLNKNTVTRHALAGSISTPLMFWTDQVLDVNDVLWLLKMLLVFVCVCVTHCVCVTTVRLRRKFNLLTESKLHLPFTIHLFKMYVCHLTNSNTNALYYI